MGNGFLLTTAEHILKGLSRVISAVPKSLVTQLHHTSYFSFSVDVCEQKLHGAFFPAVLLCHVGLPSDWLEKKQALEVRSPGWQAEFKHLIEWPSASHFILHISFPSWLSFVISRTQISGWVALLLIICLTHIQEPWSQSKPICTEHSTKLTNAHTQIVKLCAKNKVTIIHNANNINISCLSWLLQQKSSRKQSFESETNRWSIH